MARQHRFDRQKKQYIPQFRKEERVWIKAGSGLPKLQKCRGTVIKQEGDVVTARFVRPDGSTKTVKILAHRLKTEDEVRAERPKRNGRDSLFDNAGFPPMPRLGEERFRPGTPVWVKSGIGLEELENILGKVIEDHNNGLVTVEFSREPSGRKRQRIRYDQIETHLTRRNREEATHRLGRRQEGDNVARYFPQAERQREEAVSDVGYAPVSANVAVDSYSADNIREVYDGEPPEPEPEDEESLVEEVEEISPEAEYDEAIEDLANRVLQKRAYKQEFRVRSQPGGARVRNSQTFQTGDFVKLNKFDMHPIYDRAVGRILTYSYNNGRYLVEFDSPVPRGHDGGGRGAPRCCKWYYRKDLRPAGGFIPPRENPRQESRQLRVQSVPRLAQNSWAKKKNNVSKFGIGVRVQVLENPRDREDLRGAVGTIIARMGGFITIEFDYPIHRGHAGSHGGTGAEGFCWNILVDYVKIIEDGNYYIKEEYIRGGRDLKDQSVTVLARIYGRKNESCIVQFEEEVPEGHSADGQGKRSHCLTVPATILAIRRKEKSKAKTKAEAK